MSIKKYVKEQYDKMYSKNFNKAWGEYNALEAFKISENVNDKQSVSEEAHFIMRQVAQYHMEEVFKAMKIDMDDPNVAGEKGTPYRVIKMWTGSGLDDSTELLSGRWSNRPRIASFPNTDNLTAPITKRVDLTAVCSHHLAPFSTFFREDSYAIVSYIPDEKVLGISKLQRFVDWTGRRGHLQEGLTKLIYDEVSEAAGTKNVYVRLVNLSHTCESLRGAQACDGSFTSEHWGGQYDDNSIREQVNQSIK